MELRSCALLAFMRECAAAYCPPAAGSIRGAWPQCLPRAPPGRHGTSWMPARSLARLREDMPPRRINPRQRRAGPLGEPRRARRRLPLRTSNVPRFGVRWLFPFLSGTRKRTTRAEADEDAAPRNLPADGEGRAGSPGPHSGAHGIRLHLLEITASHPPRSPAPTRPV